MTLGTIEALGLIRTLSLFWRNYVAHHRRSRTSIKRKSNRPLLTIRPGTTDLHTFFQIFALQEYCADAFPQFSKVRTKYADLLRRGIRPYIVDCGVNIGLSSVWLAELFPECTVAAVEPSPGNFKVLLENVAAYPQIVPMHAAIWDTNCSLQISNPTAAHWSQRVKPHSGDSSVPVDTVTINQLLLDNGSDDALLMVKIDVEGSEKELFRSNTEWIAKAPLVAIQTHDWQQPFQQISANLFHQIAQHSCEICFSGENLFIFVN